MAVPASSLPGASGGEAAWTARVHDTAGESLRASVEELVVAPLPLRPGDPVGPLAAAALRELELRVLLRSSAEVSGRAQRAEASGDHEEAGRLWARAMELTAEHKRLRAASA